MKPATIDLTVESEDADAIYIGLAFGPMGLQLTDADDNPIPLPGWQVWAWVKTKPGTALIFDLNPTIVDEDLGIILIDIAKEDTFGLPPGKYTWDLIVQPPDGKRTGPVIIGKADIIELDTEPDITL